MTYFESGQFCSVSRRTKLTIAIRAITRIIGAVMKLVSSVVAVAILSVILPAQAQVRKGSTQTAPLATTDRLENIYRVSGVSDNGGAQSTGIATVFHCTNLSAETERLRFVVRADFGAVLADHSFNVPSLRTHTSGTHVVNLFTLDAPVLSPGIVLNQGFVDIHSTSLNVHCSAMIVDAAASVPQGIALHMVRVNPVKKTQE